MNKLTVISLLLSLCFFVSSCSPQPPVIIHFKDGTTVSCDRVVVQPIFTTCVHASTFSETHQLYRTDTIEKFSQ